MVNPVSSHAESRSRDFKHRAQGLFHRWSESYDRSLLNFLVFRPAYMALLEEIAAWRVGRPARDLFHLLDIGCGTGSFAAMVRSSPWPVDVTALDFVASMCRLAREKLEGTPAAELVHIVNGDSEHLPFPSGSFDVVTCSNSFHHYPHQDAVVCEMRRVLRPGGKLILIDGFRDNAIGWFVFDVVVQRVERNVHHAPWSLVRRLFQQAGFTDIRHRKINLLAPLLVTTGIAP